MATNKPWWLLPLLCLAACGNGSNHEKYVNTHADSAATAAAPAVALNSPERKIIHTVDFDCKVQNVVAAVNRLEGIVKSAGGIIEESKLDNSTGETTDVYYKPDSLKQLHTYTTTATLTLKVPVASLDSVVHSIPGMVSFINSRTLKQTDVTAQYMGGDALINKGTKVYSEEKAVKLAKKADDLIKVQQYEDENTAAFIDRKVAQMQMNDAVTYATLTVALSQPQQVYTQIVVDPSYLSGVPFFTRLGLAVNNGLDVLKQIVIGLINIWPLLLIGGGMWVLYRRVKRGKPQLSNK